MQANPAGGTVSSGVASISSAGNTETINQSTANAIINWQQFSIASGEATKFFVPSAAAATLNRVAAGNPSAIYGTLSSNGRLILINPSGIVVGPSGRIDTASFIGSTLDVSDSDFLAGGNLHFLGDGAGAIDNEGKIHASGGDVYLIASRVLNGGSISAPQGNVGLAAGSDVLFEQAGDQHLYVQANPLSTTRATGVTNAGTIRAATAELTAAGGNAYALAINNTGQIAATGFKKVNGQVYLTADGGDITNSGEISARNANGDGGTIVLDSYGANSPGTTLSSGQLVAAGQAAEATGGTVEVLGNDVGITDDGLVDVSGDAGGGTVLLGGDEHGANEAIPDADQTYLAPGATIEADALTLGDGGKVIVWGNDTTQDDGAISVRGGAEGGNGGFVETSAHTLNVQNAPDLAAPNGTGGSWLLDPSDVTIDDDINDSGYTVAQPAFTLSADSVTINQGTLLTALESGSVTIDASTGTGNGSGTITWNSSTPFDPSLTAATTLTLDAPVSITLNNVNIAASGAALNFVLNENITGAGSVQVNNSTIALNGGSFTAHGNGYTSSTDENGNIDGVLISNSTINAQEGDITLVGNAGYGDTESGIQAGNGVYLGGGGSFTTQLETSGTGNITITATFDQAIDSSSGIQAFNMYAGSSNTYTDTDTDVYTDEATVSQTNTDSISVASGLLSITGNVLAGSDTQEDDQGSNITGIEVGGGATLSATAAGGSISLTGTTAGATAYPSGSSVNNVNTTGISLDGYGGGGTTVISLVGASDGVGGVLTLHGTGGPLDTSSSLLSGGHDLPYSTGVNLNDGVEITTGANATININGTGGTVTTTSAYTGGSTGVSLNGGSDGGVALTMGAGGTLSITGYGGSVNAGDGSNASDAESAGVSLGGGADGDSITLATGGSISITGTGGALNNSETETTEGKDNPDTQGVSIDSGAQVTAEGTTTITLMGTGGAITSGYNINGNAIGVNIGSGDGSNLTDTVVSSDSGEIMITGIAGSTPNLGIGAEVHGFSDRTTSLTSTSGDIIITGTGGTGYNGNDVISGNSIPNYGIAILNGVELTTGEAGTITLIGTGRSNSFGIAVEEVSDTTFNTTPVLPQISAGGSFTAAAGSGSGIYFNGSLGAASATFGTETTPGNAATITSGPLEISGSAITLADGAFVAYGAGNASPSSTNGDPTGIEVSDSTINAQGGPITLTGTGGYIFDGTDDEDVARYEAGNAVLITSDESGTTELETTGSNGNITITGTDDNAIDAFSGMYGVTIDGSGTAGSTTLSVGSGLLSVTGKILAGSAVGAGEDGATLIGVEVGNDAQLMATTGAGSIDLDGDVSGASSTVSGSNFSFVAGVEVGSSATVGVQAGTITIDGAGAPLNAASYTGENDAFTAGVQIDSLAQITGGANAQILIDGTEAPSTTAENADLAGTVVNLGAQISAGNGGTVSITGTAPQTSVTSSADGNTSAGLEIDSSGSDSVTSVTVGTNGTLELTGTAGAVDATANSGTYGQAGSAGIDVSNGSTITAGLGTGVTITGTGGAATTTSGNAGASGGFVLDNASLTLDGGNVSQITGTGGTVDDGTNVATSGGNTAKTDGVAIEAGSLVSEGTGSSLTVIGYGGNLTTTDASASTESDTFPGTSGVSVHGEIEAMGNATLSLTGFGGNVTSGSSVLGSSIGVDVGNDHNDVLISSQTGGITINGTAGTSPNLGIGVVLHGFNGYTSTVESTTGTIEITGTGGPGNSGPGSFTGFFEPNDGVALVDATTVKTTAGGAIVITGTEGSGLGNGAGVATQELSDTAVDSAPVPPQVDAEGGALTIVALDDTPLLLQNSSLAGQTVTLGARTTTGNVSLDSVTATTLDLDAAGNITQTGPVLADLLNVSSGGSVVLANPGNNISSLGGISASGPLTIYTDPGLELTSTVAGSGSMLLESIGGNLTLDSGASIADSGSGGNVTLVTDEDFINEAGSSAITTTDGSYDIYAANPASTNLGGLPVAFTQYDTFYPTGSSNSGNGVFYAADGVNSGGNPPGGGTPGGGGPVEGAPVTGPGNGGSGGTGGDQLPTQFTNPDPIFTLQPPPPPETGTQPPAFGYSGNGQFGETGIQTGGLAYSSGSGGQVGAGDAAQMNNGQMNNVSNPHAAGALDTALSIGVHDTLQEALVSVGDFAPADTGVGPVVSTPAGGATTIVGDGGVVEIGNAGVKNIPLSSAPKPLQDALGSGVMQGLQPAGH